MEKDVSKWVKYTINQGAKLVCQGYAPSENSGVFFVGLDMTPNDNEITCPLIRQLEPHHHEESNSRIYFLDPNNLPSNLTTRYVAASCMLFRVVNLFAHDFFNLIF